MEARARYAEADAAYNTAEQEAKAVRNAAKPEAEAVYKAGRGSYNAIHNDGQATYRAVMKKPNAVYEAAVNEARTVLTQTYLAVYAEGGGTQSDVWDIMVRLLTHQRQLCTEHYGL